MVLNLVCETCGESLSWHCPFVGAKRCSYCRRIDLFQSKQSKRVWTSNALVLAQAKILKCTSDGFGYFCTEKFVCFLLNTTTLTIEIWTIIHKKLIKTIFLMLMGLEKVGHHFFYYGIYFFIPFARNWLNLLKYRKRVLQLLSQHICTWQFYKFLIIFNGLNYIIK